MSDNPWSANAVAVAQSHNVRKIVTMSAFGVADSWSNMPFLLRLTIKSSNMSHQWEDHMAVDKEMKASGMDYVLARPVMLKEGEAKPVKFFGNTGGKGVGLTSSITRKSVARFLVEAAEKSEWDRSTPVITN